MFGQMLVGDVRVDAVGEQAFSLAAKAVRFALSVLLL
jgi:hypothetical protein